MKRHLPAFLSFLVILVFLNGCKKPGHDTQYVELNETVLSNAMYTLDLSQYGDEDDIPSISTQATDYTVSEIRKDAVSSKNIYNFSSAAKSASAQTVVITLKEGNHPNGPRRNCNRDEAVITIHFSVK